MMARVLPVWCLTVAFHLLFSTAQSEAVTKIDSEGALPALPLALHALYPALQRLVSVAHPVLNAEVQAIGTSAALSAAQAKLAQAFAPAPGGGKKAAKKAAAASASASSGGSAGASATKFTNEDVVKPTLGDVDWASAGLMSSLKLIFDAALGAAFPQCDEDQALCAAVITRCGNPAFGDFQCNNAMALSKALKGLQGYSGKYARTCMSVSVRGACVGEGRNEWKGNDYRLPATLNSGLSLLRQNRVVIIY